MKVYPYNLTSYFKTIPVNVSVSTKASVFLVFKGNESMQGTVSVFPLLSPF